MIVGRYDNADCLERMSEEEYDYVFSSLPDYEDADNVSRALG